MIKLKIIVSNAGEFKDIEIVEIPKHIPLEVEVVEEE
jgi:hypothetical protein